MDERKLELVKLLAEECTTMQDVQNLLKDLFRGTIEQMLEAEMDKHLGYEKHSLLGDGSGNSRNGYGKKTLRTEFGETEISVSRDRNGEFEPKVIAKYQTRTDDLEGRILAMYAKGMSNNNAPHCQDNFSAFLS
jgi:putative transposase